jgi:hypothetical protein
MNLRNGTKAWKQSRERARVAVLARSGLLFMPVLRFMDASLLRCQQAVSHPVKIAQGEEHGHLREVLCDTPVTHLRMPPQLLTTR